MRLPAFLATSFLCSVSLFSQVVPPTTDVSRAISALGNGMIVQSIAVDSTGNVYLAGTSSAGFPSATQTFGPRGGDADVFIVKTNATGDTILYSVAIGGTSTDSARSIKVDASGNAYVLATTLSLDFPNTKQYTPNYPIGSVLFKLNATGTALTYSTQLGSRVSANAFDVDSTGAAYVGGSANAQDITTTTGVIKPAPIAGAGQNDYYPFIVKLSTSGDAFSIATYYGVADKAIESLSVRSNGILISSAGSLSLLNAALTVQTATVSTAISPANIAFDAAGNIYVAGTSIGGFRLRKYDSALTATALDKMFQFTSTTTPPRIAVAGNGRIYLFGQPISAQFFQTKNATQPCLVNLAPPNGPAGTLASDSSGNPISATGQPLPPDQGLIITDAAGEILHATFLTANVAQAVTASSGKIYVAATQTLFTTPDRTTWRGILRFDPAVIPAEKASPSCVVHGAYFQPVPLTPGGIMTIFGNHLGPADFTSFKLDTNNRVPTTLAGLSVTVDNRPAALWFTYDKQINFITPWATRTDGAAVPVCVTYDGATNCIQVSTGVAAPGAIVCDQASGLSCALNQDYSINWSTAPAAPGSTVQIFMMGLGSLTGSVVDGGVNTTLQLVQGTMTAQTEPFIPGGGCGLFSCNAGSSGFRTVDVGYAGAAPSLILGAYQVNIKVPDDMPSGLQTFTLNFKPTGSTTNYTTQVKLQIR